MRTFVAIEIHLRELIDLGACRTAGSGYFQFFKGSAPWDNIKFKACKSVINKIEKRCVRPSIAFLHHYSDVMMSAIASQITVITIVYSTVCSHADRRKHRSSASLAFVPVDSPHKRSITRKMFLLMASSWQCLYIYKKKSPRFFRSYDFKLDNYILVLFYQECLIKPVSRLWYG